MASFEVSLQFEVQGGGVASSRKVQLDDVHWKTVLRQDVATREKAVQLPTGDRCRQSFEHLGSGELLLLDCILHLTAHHVELISDFLRGTTQPAVGKIAFAGVSQSRYPGPI